MEELRKQTNKQKCLLQGGKPALTLSISLSLTEGGTGGRVKERVEAIWTASSLIQFHKSGINLLNVSENVFSSKWLSAKP